MFSFLGQLWPAKASNKSIGSVAAICFLGLLFAKFVLHPISPSLCPPLYAVIFLTLGWIAFQRPLWGIVTIVALLPVERLLPSVSFATSVYPVLGVFTLAGYVVHDLLIRRAKPVITWTHLFGFCFLLWISLVTRKRRL